MKPQILKDGADFAKKIGSKNPDIGINKAGNIIFKNPKTGKTIDTDLDADWFIQ